MVPMALGGPSSPCATTTLVSSTASFTTGRGFDAGEPMAASTCPIGPRPAGQINQPLVRPLLRHSAMTLSTSPAGMICARRVQAFDDQRQQRWIRNQRPIGQPAALMMSHMERGPQSEVRKQHCSVTRELVGRNVATLAVQLCRNDGLQWAPGGISIKSTLGAIWRQQPPVDETSSKANERPAKRTLTTGLSGPSRHEIGGPSPPIDAHPLITGGTAACCRCCQIWPHDPGPARRWKSCHAGSSIVPETGPATFDA